VIILYRRFGTTYLSHLQGSRSPQKNAGNALSCVTFHKSADLERKYFTFVIIMYTTQPFSHLILRFSSYNTDSFFIRHSKRRALIICNRQPAYVGKSCDSCGAQENHKIILMYEFSVLRESQNFPDLKCNSEIGASSP